MATSVKGPKNFGIAQKVEALRLQLMVTETSRRIGERIRGRRKQLGLTQRQVAERMESKAVTGQHVSDWERGQNQPSTRYLLELVPALEVPDYGYFYELPAEAPDLMDAPQPAQSSCVARTDRAEARRDPGASGGTRARWRRPVRAETRAAYRVRRRRVATVNLSVKACWIAARTSIHASASSIPQPHSPSFRYPRQGLRKPVTRV